MEITEKMEQEYLENSGGKCPVCNSDDINADSVELDGSQGYGNVDCAECGATWTDIYKLAGIDNLEVGNVK